MIFVYIVLGVILLILLGGAYFGYFRAFYSPKKREIVHGQIPDSEQYQKAKEHIKDLISYVNSIEFEEIYIRSFDGTMLYGRYYHNADGAPLQILFHGYKGSAIRDFCGGLLLALQAGFNVIMVDQRAHGKSGGRTISFGIKERYDVLEWVKYANNRFSDTCPIILTGISMGASTVLMALGVDLPDNVVGVIADCPFSSPSDIIKTFCKDMGVISFVAYPFAYLGGLLFGGFRLNATGATETVKNATIPIAIFHGESDSIVPCDMAKKIHNSYGGKDKFIYTFEGADHGMSYMSDNKKYESAYNDFVALCIDKYKNK